MPIKIVHILIALLLFLAACSNNDSSNSHNPVLPKVSQVVYRETSGTVSPDTAWDEQHTVSSSGLTFTRTGFSSLTTVNTGTWTINSYDTNEATLFTELSGSDVYNVEKIDQDAAPVGGGIKVYTVTYDNGEIREVIIGDGSIYKNAGPIMTPLINYISKIILPTDASKVYLAQTGGAIQKGSLNLTASSVMTTFTGSVVFGSSDGTGTAALFDNPRGITTDGSNLYVVDMLNHTIRQIVISTGQVATLAGTAGASGSTDGMGSDARFYYPTDITTDGTYLYIADQGNAVIRKVVISTGMVTTLAGKAGIVDYLDETGTAARFGSPNGITTDGTNLYVTDSASETIRQIVISSGAVTTLAGSPMTSGSTNGIGLAASFNFPYGITTDGTNLYVVDTLNYTIRQIVISTGEVTTLAGTVGVPGSSDGIGSAARFKFPEGISSDGTNLYVADPGSNTVRRIVISTGDVATLGGSFICPSGVTTNGTTLYVTDALRILQVHN